MKARNRATFEDVQNYYFSYAISLVADSISVMMLALNEELGIGSQRLNRVIKRYMKINKHYNDYRDDNLRTVEIRKRLDELGLSEYADFLLGYHELKKYQHELKVEAKQVTVVEAANMQKQLQLMKELMNNK